MTCCWKWLKIKMYRTPGKCEMLVDGVLFTAQVNVKVLFAVLVGDRLVQNKGVFISCVYFK